MTQDNQSLPESVTRIAANGRDIYLIGTAHVSRASVRDVRITIEALRPDSVCVELCEARRRAMTQRDQWRKMDIFRIIREKKSMLLLAQLMMTSFYRRLGRQLGVQPGAEMLEAINRAESTGAHLVAADRDIQITMKRVWGYLRFWSKLKMLSSLLGGLFEIHKIDESLIEDLKKRDQLENMLEEFAEAFPAVKSRLIDERDICLAQKIRTAPGTTVVAVVGAGHVPGIRRHIRNAQQIEPLCTVPPRSLAPRLIGWTIPVAIVALVAWGFLRGDTQHSMESIYIWVLINGALSALGAALALAHPLTIAASFVAAPITSLNPMIAAGWVSGLVQAWVKKPTVADLEDLPNAISSVKGFWMNPLTRILLVVVLANVGSSLGTFISGGWIAARTFQ